MKKLLRLLLKAALFALLIIAAIVAFNTVNFTSKQLNIAAVEKPLVEEAALERLSAVIQMPTVSFPERIDTFAFEQFREYVDTQFVLVDSLLERSLVNEYSLLYKWQGKNQKLKPILLMGHIDVVPVNDQQEKQWEQPPFSGLVKDGYVWGRGSLDDKVSIMAVLEAFELLLEKDYQPERTVYLACGHDEEVGGRKGAQAIARRLEQQGVQLEYVLDEGSVVVTDALNGLDAPAALIGIAEKGYATLTLSVSLPEGGHSSMPPAASAIGLLSSAISKISNQPFPANMNGPVRPLLEQLGPEMRMPFKAVFANLWLFKGIVRQQLAASPSSNAMLRTTTAPTVIQGGFKENVLPTDASAKINYRILPGETLATTIERVNAIVADDRVEVFKEAAQFSADPSPVSSEEAFGFQVIQKTS